MRTLLLALVSASLAVACSNDPVGYVNSGYPSYPTNVLSVDIDTGAQRVGVPGKEVGVNVAYRTGGTWHVETTCDTTQSGYSCAWDLVVSVKDPNALSTTSTGPLRVDSGAFRIVLPTETASDSFDFTAPGGVPLELDVILDGVHGNWANHTLDAWMVNWVQNGAEQLGAPSNPVDFVPTTP